MSISVNREQISHTEKIIRPYVRRTPIIELEGSDVGLSSTPVTLKLELLQHSGAFKVRGAFANLLTRHASSAGVTAPRAAITGRQSRTRREPCSCQRRFSFRKLLRRPKLNAFAATAPRSS